MKKKIGFIGLGAMGKPMAQNLLKASYQLTIFDINPRPVAELVAWGAEKRETPAQVAKDAEVVITMLPADEEVKAVILGEEGVLSGAKAGLVIIDMSSIAPHTSMQVASELNKKGIKFLDAPVSGGTIGAENGTLTIMVGGDKTIFEEHKDILQAMGKNIYYIGEVGMGETIKMVNQMLVANNIVAIAEAFVMGTKLGLDPEVIYHIIRISAGNSVLIDQRVPNFILKGDFTQPGFALDLLRKDAGLAVESAKINKVPLFLTSQSYQLLTMASAEGLGRKDMSAIIELFERAAGVSVRKK
jgi:2-hydroxy-3-oxopropionate reductase